ncbi:hypothetical protein FM104_11020 [Microbacterium esteraromaticum]|uniref:DUF559 domain-containing protein n=1 Tax=Microbacterium esteraromaticum TaxID=57043 RepID=A0A1R4K8Q3_9MICO|nr:DUF559 domain-containing protein [Microbacterium esteraromaticum]SJN40700.1 hypothetical protein FM104_11020 [Microbacterium esteraromaticum]
MSFVLHILVVAGSSAQVVASWRLEVIGLTQSEHMPKKHSPLPPQLGVRFSTSQAMAQGLTRRRLRGNDLQKPFHGTRRTHADIAAEKKRLDQDFGPLALSRRRAEELLSRVLTYMQVMPAGAFICGRSAAVLRGYPLGAARDRRRKDDLEVGVITPRTAPRGKGVKGRRLAERFVQIEEFKGVPVMTPATMWAMLGRELAQRELTILADAIVHIPRDSFAVRHPERADATLADLQDAIEAGPQKGVARLRAALARARTGSASPLETEYRLDAEDAGLPTPELDVEIRDENGRLLGISEFVYRRYRLIVEIEGDHHRTSREQWNRDIEKYRAYAEAGWEVVRLTSTHIRGRRTAVGIVRTALIRRHKALTA